MEEAEGHMKRYGTDYFPLTIEAHLELMRQCGFQTVESERTGFFFYAFICHGEIAYKNNKKQIKNAKQGGVYLGIVLYGNRQ